MPSDLPDAHSGAQRSPVARVEFDIAARKRQLREKHRAARHRLSPEQRRRRDNARMNFLVPLLPRGAVVATYLSRDDEPATLSAAAVLWRHGHRVLVPVLSDRAHRLRKQPRWAWYWGPSALRPGYRGIPEPAGPVLPAETLTEADVIIVSGLAGGRDGTRLGAGAGWFDRALEHARDDAIILLLVDRDEVLDTVPATQHDKRVHGIVTESGVVATSRSLAIDGHSSPQG